MTNPMLAELDAVVRLMEAATEGEWGSWHLPASGTSGDAFGHLIGPPIRYRDRSQGFTPDDAHLIARSVNFLRTHHATLADMAKRLEAAKRDSGRAKLEAERDFLHDWLQYAFYPVGMDCCGRRQGGDCCGDGVPVYATLPDVQQAMNKRLGEIEDAIAAIDATQEGEG